MIKASLALLLVVTSGSQAQTHLGGWSPSSQEVRDIVSRPCPDQVNQLLRIEGARWRTDSTQIEKDRWRSDPTISSDATVALAVMRYRGVCGFQQGDQLRILASNGHVGAQAALEALQTRVLAQAEATAQRLQEEQSAAEQRKQRELTEQRERERREQAAEAEFKAFLAATKDPQDLYLRAGKYERSSEAVQARKTYEYIVDTFPKTQWAVKSNDRLLQMRSEAAVRGSMNQPEPSARRSDADSGLAERLGAANARMQGEALRTQREDEMRQRFERERQERERADADFVRRQNEQIRRQNEQWEAEERRRRQQPN